MCFLGPPAIRGLGNGSGFSIMIQDKGGNDPQYLSKYTNKFIETAKKRPEIARAFTTLQLMFRNVLSKSKR